MWSPQQDKALVSVSDWIREARSQVYRLFGYAGTGKTTLAQELASNVPGVVQFAAYTGKAAHVMASKGCYGASTIHSLIYRPAGKSQLALVELQRSYEDRKDVVFAKHEANCPAGREVDMLRVENDAKLLQIKREIKKLKDNLKRPSFVLNPDSVVQESNLIIIDECSMVGEEMAEDLMSFGTPILVLGDPAQLPPVGGNGYFINSEPDSMLTEIHRQAADNPIIEMATKVRLGEALPYGDYGNSRVIPKKVITPEEALNADQILVGMNRTRHTINRRQRELLGHGTQVPVVGDKLVCLKNNRERGLMNGSLWAVDEVGDSGKVAVELLVSPEGDGDPQEVLAHMCYFDKDVEEPDYWDRKDFEEFDFGYALTVHKSQGSQWGEVVVFDESHVFKENKLKWLYTGITRASETLTVVR